jgi:hypothetical protein
MATYPFLKHPMLYPWLLNIMRTKVKMLSLCFSTAEKPL